MTPDEVDALLRVLGNHPVEEFSLNGLFVRLRRPDKTGADLDVKAPEPMPAAKTATEKAPIPDVHTMPDWEVLGLPPPKKKRGER